MTYGQVRSTPPQTVAEKAQAKSNERYALARLAEQKAARKAKRIANKS